MPLAPGTRLGPYVVNASLASGGMGEVYRARDDRLGCEMAVKVLRPDPDHGLDSDLATLSGVTTPGSVLGTLEPV